MQSYSPVKADLKADLLASFCDPVFVLCNGRSGSTLLRFLLDAHPDLACPPETNLPALCAQLATVWSLIEGAPLAMTRGDEPPDIPDAAITGIRETMDRMVGSYLARRGKKRYCDKSLGTARYTELLTRVYPEARFICLYRHPMDVIASGLEACPWGLNGYGFDPYIATTPGNAVLALARFWADNTMATLATEERFPENCIRMRYEDLVTDPEGTAAALFDFLGIPMVPRISETCFSAERERFGPADYKIWYTSSISADSVGRGWSVPIGLIAPAVLEGINELAGKLGYLPVDGSWGTTEPPADFRVPLPGGDEALSRETSSAGPAIGVVPARSRLLERRLRAGLADVKLRHADVFAEHEAEKFVAVWISSDPAGPAEYWQVDLGAGAVTPASQAAQETSDWDIVGLSSAWEQVLAGKLNLSAALRACQLRYCDGTEQRPLVSDSRLALLAALLGIATWPAPDGQLSPAPPVSQTVQSGLAQYAGRTT